MSDIKQVKVDNWGIYFLQRLKHFFNRTDYCDLTLQFQDNAQLKVHRLVLSACTEYFELLERTCEMYEDCLVMPDDLQADVVVPIVNFMYTGQLEFKVDLLEKLYQTSQIMNIPVLTKLLDAQRNQLPKTHNYSGVKHYSKSSKSVKQPTASSSSGLSKRTYSQAFDSNAQKEKKIYTSVKPDMIKGVTYESTSPNLFEPVFLPKKKSLKVEPRPTRYELPEELESDNIFNDSFTDISYTSKPLMIHPETAKHHSSKKSGIFGETSNSKKYVQTSSTVDIVECKRIPKDDNIFEDNLSESVIDESEFLEGNVLNVENSSPKDSSQLFDQILDNSSGTKVTIQAKDSQSSNIDHAKIISEVLKKYPHLVKSNKNIKLKILNTPNKTKKSKLIAEERVIKTKSEPPDFTYETDMMDSKVAAKLIAMGAENVNGPWICLICGTPGKALHFNTYYKFRRHLVEVHHEKPISNMCEYCGLKSLKRNYLLHHIYTKHGIEPPPQYHFPKCNLCSYVALTEGFLVKHKMTHTENKNFRCNVCASSFNSSKMLLTHIQRTGHKYSADRKTNLQCIYCLRVFLREPNLYAHLKTQHKNAAKNDGIIDDSDEENHDTKEKIQTQVTKSASIKYEVPVNYYSENEDDTQYQIEQGPDGNIQVVSTKSRTTVITPKQKILNAGFGTPTHANPKPKTKNISSIHNEFINDINIPSPSIIQNDNNEIIMIDGCEYIMKDRQLLPRPTRSDENDEEYIISDTVLPETEQQVESITPRSVEYSEMQNRNSGTSVQNPVVIKKSANINQPIQFVVSNEEEYKALMSSNHSIIFDDGDTNKTLTVLTTPHDTTLDAATIDLENTQSNDMMIIQEDYPLNAPEAVSTNNSNIVVVYSHPIDEQNKQFQLISSQNLGTQFVQSSAVITQNYDSTTTTTQVMSAQIIDAQPEESWQNNDQQRIQNLHEQMNSQPQLHEMTVVDQTVIKSTENVTSNISELPEIQLTQKRTESQVDQPNNEPTLNQSNTNAKMSENVEQIVEEVQQNTSSPMDVDESASTTTEETNAVIQGEDTENIQIVEQVDIPQCNSSEENSNIIESQPQGSVDLQGETKSYEISNEDVQLETVDNIHTVEMAIDSTVNVGDELETTNIVNSEDVGEKQEVVIVNNVTDVKEHTEATVHHEHSEEQLKNSEVITVTKISKEQINKLASEWSDDEEEMIAQDDDNIGNPSKYITEKEASSVEASAEIEESIENIQQEMEKQLSENPDVEVETRIVLIEDVNSLKEHVGGLKTNEPESAKNVTLSKEKISSLLNDWDENDSQDESVPANEEEIPTQPPSEAENATAVGEEIESIEQKSSPKKDDKIKRLVSDWDDDDDEDENKD